MTRRHVRMLSAHALRLRLLAAGVAALGLLASPAGAATYTGHRLYAVATSSTTGRLVPFDVGADGQLHERGDQAVTLPGNTTGLAVDRQARSVFVSSRDVHAGIFSSTPGMIEVFTIGADGAPTPRADGARVDVRDRDGARRVALLAEAERRDRLLSGAGPTARSAPNARTSPSPSPPTPSPSRRTARRSTWPGRTTSPSSGRSRPTPRSASSPRGCSALPAVRAIRSSSGSPSAPSNVDIQCYFGNGFTFSAGGDGALSVSGGAFTGSGATFGNVEDARGRAFYGGVGAGGIAQFKRQADGTLAPFPTPSVPAPGQTRVLAVDPDGTALTAAITANGFQTYAIAADGSLSAAPVASTPIAMSPPSYLAYAPQQAPLAAFGTTQAASGATAFDAGASQAFGARTIARYDWSFGDGTALADAGPAPSHSYPQPGEYTATLSVTDSAGCSLAGSFNGSLSICAGGPGATASQTVHVTAPAPPAEPGTPAVPAVTGLLSAPRPGATRRRRGRRQRRPRRTAGAAGCC